MVKLGQLGRGAAWDFYLPGSVVMRNTVIGLLLSLALANAAARADVSLDSLSPPEVSNALAAIADAKKIVEAGRGSLLMAGAVLSSDGEVGSMVVAVIDYPSLEKMKPGTILLLAKKNCEPVEDCLVARRVIGRDSSGGLQTERYGAAEPFLLDSIQATLLGAVIYAVDLQTRGIRDMRPDRKSDHVSLAEAVAEESKH
jgi:hypothetical protein